MRYCSMQLKLYCILPVHNKETFQQTFGLYLFLLVEVNMIYIPVLHISLVNHM